MIHRFIVSVVVCVGVGIGSSVTTQSIENHRSRLTTSIIGRRCRMITTRHGRRRESWYRLWRCCCSRCCNCSWWLFVVIWFLSDRWSFGFCWRWWWWRRRKWLYFFILNARWWWCHCRWLWWYWWLGRWLYGHWNNGGLAVHGVRVTVSFVSLELVTPHAYLLLVYQLAQLFGLDGMNQAFATRRAHREPVEKGETLRIANELNVLGLFPVGQIAQVVTERFLFEQALFG